MEKTGSVIRPKARVSRAQSGGVKRRPKAAKPTVNLDLYRAEVAKMIDQIREEVEFHHGCAAEVKAKLEKLTGTAFSELLKVKELKSIIISLKENDQDNPAAEAPVAISEPTSPAAVGDPKEQWKRELDQELEKLLIIRKLLEASLPAATEKKEPPTALPSANGVKKILVVDDDLTTVKIISHFLQKENYRVSTSLSGVDGLKKAFKETPDLILLDVMMPDLNGFQFLSIYRKDEENHRTPVVILSSLSEEADVLKGLEIGAVDYITKPFSPQVLMAKIKKNLNSGP
jgi:PleD family two-component response regulator